MYQPRQDRRVRVSGRVCELVSCGVAASRVSVPGLLGRRDPPTLDEVFGQRGPTER